MRRGERNPMFGRKHTPEALALIGAGARVTNARRQYVPVPQRIVIPDETTLAYIAGLVDADGSIRFRKGRPFVSIYNTNTDLIAWLMRTLGHGSVSNGNLGREQVVAWSIQAARDVYALVTAIRPWLIVKADDADAALAHLLEKYGEEVVANGGNDRDRLV